MTVINLHSYRFAYYHLVQYCLSVFCQKMYRLLGGPKHKMEDNIKLDLYTLVPISGLPITQYDAEHTEC